MRWREMNILAECLERVKHGLEAIEKAKDKAQDAEITNAGFNASEIHFDLIGP